MTHIRAAREKAGFTLGPSDDLCAQSAYTPDQGESDQNAFHVVDDWPDKIPVTSQEVEAIYRFLGPLLDAFLRSLS